MDNVNFLGGVVGVEYAIAAIGGLMAGFAVALAKHFFIWRPYAKGRADNLYQRMAISSAVNVLTLLAVFLARDIWPYSFYITIIAVAVGLSGGGKIFSRYIVKGQDNKIE